VLIAEQSAVSTGHSMQTTEQSVHSKGCQVSGREQFLIGAECKGFGTGNSGATGELVGCTLGNPKCEAQYRACR